VLTSEGSRRANLEIRNIRLADKVDLLVDVTICHDFIGDGRSGLTQGQLRNPDNPDHILENAAADKIRNYRDAYAVNCQVAFLPACMSTSGRIHGEFLRLLFFLSNKQADDYFADLGYEAHKEEFCHRRSVFFYRNQCTIGLACAQAVALRGAPTTVRRHASAPRNRPPPHLAADNFRWADFKSLEYRYHFSIASLAGFRVFFVPVGARGVFSLINETFSLLCLRVDLQTLMNN
jgi:hypothetical protein